MGLYVEVMCDVRDETPLSVGSIHHRCESHENDNPQGHSIGEARRAARKAKWIVIGNFTCCPNCAVTDAGKAAIANAKAGA